MSGLTLILGNRNYSSWSMRAWLAMEQTGAPYREETIWLDQDPDRRQRLERSPAGRVPVLLHGDLAIWDSLAIVEYLAELFPGAGLWPSDSAARARARSLASEMHSGFIAIRENLPLNCRARTGARDRGAEVEAEVRRIAAMWSETRREFGSGGPYLFGRPCAADAFYAPVASRFLTYSIRLEGEAAAYSETLLADPGVVAWMARAGEEEHSNPVYDALLD